MAVIGKHGLDGKPDRCQQFARIAHEVRDGAAADPPPDPRQRPHVAVDLYLDVGAEQHGNLIGGGTSAERREERPCDARVLFLAYEASPS